MSQICPKLFSIFLYFPHVCVWGFVFDSVSRSRSRPPRTLYFTHHLCHTTLSHTLSFTQRCHTPSFTHNFVTHHLSYTTLSHTIFHTQLCHTQLCHTPSFTHHFVTHHLSHTTLSHAVFHTQLCHTPSFTHNFATHSLSHTALRGRHGTWQHPPSFCVAGVALMTLGWLWWRAWAPLVTHTHNFVTHNLSRTTCHTLTHNLSHTTLSQRTLSHIHTQLFHTQLWYTQSFTDNFVTHTTLYIQLLKLSNLHHFLCLFCFLPAASTTFF